MNRLIATDLDCSRRNPGARSPRPRRLDLTMLRRLGWDGRLSIAYRRYDRPDQWPARVSRVERGVCTLLGGGGVCRASLGGSALVAGARDPARLPCVGDWVVVRTWPDARWTVELVLPRRGTMWRTPGPALSASNVDIVMRVDRDRRSDADLIGALRALLAPGHTLGLTGGEMGSRAALVAALAGAPVLAPVAGSLVLLPGGGAVIDAESDCFSTDIDEIDSSMPMPLSLARRPA